LILVGGGDNTNGEFDVVDLYDVYTHEVTSAPLGYPRRAVSVAVEPTDGGDRVWVFGGFGPVSSMSAPLSHFDLAADGTIGTPVVDGDFPGLQSGYRPAFAIGPGDWIIPESVPISLRAGTAIARPDLGDLYERAAQSPTMPHRAAFDAGAFAVAVIEGDSVKRFTLSRTMDMMIGLSRGRFLALHDQRDAYVVDPDAGTVVDMPGLRGVDDLYADAVGSNGRQVVIVGSADAEVYVAETLERLDRVLALGGYQRFGVRLSNDQIAFIDDGPTDTIHLFTPPPPEWADSVAMAGVRN
jgi:hypothetical protein